MKNKKRVSRMCGVRVFLVCFAVILIWGGFTVYQLYQVEQITDTIVVELGESFSTDLHDYISGSEWAIENSELDITGVNQDKVGEYIAYVNHGRQTFVYQMIVQDTTPPDILLESNEKYFEQGKVYSLESFVKAVNDISGNVSVGLVCATAKQERENEYSFSVCGSVLVGIVASDASGNTNYEYMHVTVDTPPEIYGMQEYYIATGSDVDYLKGITATDTIDGDVTDTVEVNLDNLDINNAGDYIITYRAVDSYGLASEATADIHVMEKNNLQEAINTHQINRHDDVIIGAYNLYDAGYYEEDNVEFIKEEMKPALVVIKPSETARGSGFIIAMTDEYVILCTNKHVVRSNEKVTVFFHNGYKTQGTVLGKDKDDDIALVRVDREMLTDELFDTLKTVHINKTYWDQLTTEKISLVMRTINENGSVWQDKEGNLILKVDDTEYDGWKDLCRVNMHIYAGCSGSAILDGHGNLIAMAVGRVFYYENGQRKVSHWGVCLSDILEFYEEIMGKPIQYC